MKPILKSLALIALPAAALLASFSSCSDPRAEAAPADDKCIQLYSLREVMGDSAKYADNYADAYARLREAGYTQVEAAGYRDGKFYGVTPEQFRADALAAGLTPISSHAGRRLTEQELAAHDFTAALDWWRQAIAAHQAAGMTYIVTPYDLTPPTMADAQTLCDYHNAVGALCSADSIKYGYHNHAHEFHTIGESDTIWYDYLASHTNPDDVFLQLDTYWCVMAGKAPVEYFKAYPGRFTMLHVKDLYEIGGSGMVGFDAIFRNDSIAGVKDCVVEIERTDGTMDIFQSCKVSSDYLDRLKANLE